MANHPLSEDLTHGKEELCIWAYWHRDVFYAMKMETVNTIFFSIEGEIEALVLFTKGI